MSAYHDQLNSCFFKSLWSSRCHCCSKLAQCSWTCNLLDACWSVIVGTDLHFHAFKHVAEQVQTLDTKVWSNGCWKNRNKWHFTYMCLSIHICKMPFIPVKAKLNFQQPLFQTITYKVQYFILTQPIKSMRV